MGFRANYPKNAVGDKFAFLGANQDGSGKLIVDFIFKGFGWPWISKTLGFQFGNISQVGLGKVAKLKLIRQFLRVYGSLISTNGSTTGFLSISLLKKERIAITRQVSISGAEAIKGSASTCSSA